MTKPSPLNGLDLSHVAEERMAETKRQLINAYERIEDLQTAMNGLLALIRIVGHRPDVPQDVREALTTDHRLHDAQELLR